MITTVVCLQWITKSHHIFNHVQIIKHCAILFFLHQTMFIKHYYRLNLAPLLVPMEYPMYFSRILHTLFVILYVTFLILASSRIASHLSGSKLLSPLFSKRELYLTLLITDLYLLLVLAVV